MINTLYTIGYSGFKLNTFIDILKENNIDLIIDVRSLPYSQYNVEYNKEHLEKILNANNIFYRNYALEFGARQDNRAYYPNGYLDFKLFSQSEQFQNGIKKMQQTMKKNYTFSLMCSEKDPIRCHRAILVSKAFHELGYQVIHLLPNKKKLTQNDIESDLLDIYFPDRLQLNMFSENLSNEEYIQLAYQKQNKLIGYSMTED